MTVPAARLAHGRLQGRTAVVTGSGRLGGLGAAIARRLGREGAHVVISDIGRPADVATPVGLIAERPAMDEVADALRAEGASVSTFACDVRDYSEVQALGRHAVEHGASLDIWVNNAGVGYVMKPLLEVEPSDWSAVIDVNLTGAFYGLRVAAELMAAQGRGGRIVNIASQAAKSGFPHAQAYTASKHALVGLVRSAAIELGPLGITVNNVCPNHVTTGLGAWQNDYFSKVTGHTDVQSYMAAMIARIPMRRPGRVEDTAEAVAFLCGDEAAYITAESMNVSGGEEPH